MVCRVLSWAAPAAITILRAGCLKHLFSHSSGGPKSKIKVPARMVPWKPLFLAGEGFSSALSSHGLSWARKGHVLLLIRTPILSEHCPWPHLTLITSLETRSPNTATLWARACDIWGANSAAESWAPSNSSAFVLGRWVE